MKCWRMRGRRWGLPQFLIRSPPARNRVLADARASTFIVTRAESETKVGLMRRFPSSGSSRPASRAFLRANSLAPLAFFRRDSANIPLDQLFFAGERAVSNRSPVENPVVPSKVGRRGAGGGRKWEPIRGRGVLRVDSARPRWLRGTAGTDSAGLEAFAIKENARRRSTRKIDLILRGCAWPGYEMHSSHSSVSAGKPVRAACSPSR